VVRTLHRRAMTIILYLLDIVICVIIGLYVHLIVALFYAVFAGISVLLGFFISRFTIGSRPDLQRYFHPDTTREHIIMSPVLLILILFPQIVRLFSPEFGLLLFLVWEHSMILFLIFSSFPLGVILLLPKEFVPIYNASEG
jgi:hypothetical protein